MTPHLGQSGASTRGAAQRGHPAVDIEPLYGRSGTTLQARTCADTRRSPTAALWCLSMKLYYVPMTRSNRPRWMLEELEVPYDLVRLDPKKGDNQKPEYLAINPTGKVPSLVDGDVKMFESAAIVAYLADKYVDKKLAPPVGAPERAAYYQWLFFGMTTLEQPVDLYGQHSSSLPPEKRVAHVADDAKSAAGRALAAVQTSLQGREWLLGRFTAADIIVGGTVLWALSLRLLEEHPALVEYANRLKDRPALQRSRKD